MYTGQKVKVDLTSIDGNAFSIMGHMRRAMRKAGLHPEVIAEYTDRATAGDYDNLLQVTMEYVDDSLEED